MFITFEGVDGSGKSSQIARFARFLEEEGRRVHMTREPGGSPGALEIRNLLLTGDADRWSPETEILLFNAARRDHVERIVRPMLEDGVTVVCDRFVDTTRVYQAATHPENRMIVDRIHEMMIGIEPHLTFVLDIDPELALARALGREDGKITSEDRMESKGLGFQKSLRQGFLDLIAEGDPRFVMIDATGDQDEVFARIRDSWRRVGREIEGFVPVP